MTPCLTEICLPTNSLNPFRTFFRISLSLLHSHTICLFRIGIPDSAVINIHFSCGPSHQSPLLLVSTAFPHREKKLRSKPQTAGYLVPLCHSNIDFFSPFVFLLRPTPWAGGAVGNGAAWRRSACWCWSSGRAAAGPWHWTRFLCVQYQTRRSELRMMTRYSRDTRGTGCGTSSLSWRSTQEMTLSMSAR